jgi:dipeptidase E
MPIIDPKGFDCIGLIPFQINPHYLDAHAQGHAGETRDQRIAEFNELILKFMLPDYVKVLC